MFQINNNTAEVLKILIPAEYFRHSFIESDLTGVAELTIQLIKHEEYDTTNYQAKYL